ncbi:protein-L-isoaspartate O-methyltransferase family protein [Methylophaga sp. OBS3]|uniref:protein-L-isoaspartate O-methyltransferase family protein n=1 Tax=Methylophaga sp. OBS3 TaxID=2991934 RepID=UPI0022523DEC|nr:protein-L-isoaspartate O-methyltransferase [Methylophaga sp. OBS3]MCX4190858.1 protein-L-isoaspartate O-methyltransferase [Methylophaga sp. OBS3]
MTAVTSTAHTNMVWQQLRPNDVSDPAVLQVLQDTDRADFVSDELKALAYADTQLPIGHGQHMWSPLQEARILQALQLTAEDTVLEIGTGSGIFTAMLAKLAGKVTSVDVHPEFTALATQRLQAKSLDNVALKTGDACQGWPLEDRVDAIVLTASYPEVPESYLEQLQVGGRLLAIIGQPPAMSVQRIRRVGETEWQTENLFETVVAPMIGAEPKPEFAF